MITSSGIGTLGWARQRNGQVVGAEVVALWWRLIRAQLAERLRRRPTAGFTTAREVDAALAEVVLPTSAPVNDALSLVTSLGPTSLVGHVLRTYAFGTLLGLRDGLQWDRELFALAALLHDVALSRRRHEFDCFAHDGAEQALALLAQHDQVGPRGEVVANAICLHLNVDVPVAQGVEAHLLRAGAGLDVVGARAAELSEQLLAAVHQRHPRGDLTDHLARVFTDDARRHPLARTARMYAVGFVPLMRKNPLARVAAFR